MSTGSLKEIKKLYHGTFKGYVTGFISALILTIISFSLVITKPFSSSIITGIIVGLAIVQAIVQLLFFLHVGQEAKPRWETLVFYFMLLVMAIVVIGSLWIMFDLNNRLMPDMMKGMSHD